MFDLFHLGRVKKYLTAKELLTFEGIQDFLLRFGDTLRQTDVDGWKIHLILMVFTGERLSLPEGTY